MGTIVVPRPYKLRPYAAYDDYLNSTAMSLRE